MWREGSEGAGDGLGGIFDHGEVRGRLFCRHRLAVGEVGLAHVVLGRSLRAEVGRSWIGCYSIVIKVSNNC